MYLSQKNRTIPRQSDKIFGNLEQISGCESTVQFDMVLNNFTFRAIALANDDMSEFGEFLDSSSRKSKFLLSHGLSQMIKFAI